MKILCSLLALFAINYSAFCDEIWIYNYTDKDYCDPADPVGTEEDLWINVAVDTDTDCEPDYYFAVCLPAGSSFIYETDDPADEIIAVEFRVQTSADPCTGDAMTNHLSINPEYGCDTDDLPTYEAAWSEFMPDTFRLTVFRGC